MKLLFDENLSPKLVGLLAEAFPGWRHVHDCGLGSSDDAAVWNYAAVPRPRDRLEESDFHARSEVLGSPPKVIWIRTGNARTVELADLLRRHARAIEAFAANDTERFLQLR